MNWEVQTDDIGYRIFICHYCIAMIGLIISFFYFLFPFGLVLIIVIATSGFALFGMNQSELRGIFYRNFYTWANLPRFNEKAY